ncbi:CDC48 family AAA ATPase [Halobacterium zhouii]|uniref:CDC48 family AAA ATPase n=1 Tax=Halobacterium zhouii TaxID=2902624 RepID=UPI001E405C9D|nr:CDC48 family AAA ATPase [Halobacterium zhouii]
MTEREVAATVREAAPRDAGRGVVRLPADARRELGVLSGDTVRVAGEESTVAKVWPAADDVASDELRADGETRANAGVRVGDTVHVTPADAGTATRIVVAPFAAHAQDDGSTADAVRRSLLDRPVSADERVKVDSLGDAGEFRVTDTAPEGTVVVDESTDVEVAESAVEPDDSAGGVGVTYEDVGGLGDELASVRELVELPLADPGRFRRLGIEPPKGVLMHGPPGTGKTLIARAVANEADAHFQHVSGPEIVRKYKGESEEQLREIFEDAAENAPAVVFFDEIDAIAAKREDTGDTERRVVAQLLSLMDGLEARGEVVVIAATNRPNDLDPALRRPGRFDREVEIGVPDEAGRREILDIHARGMPLADDVDLDALAARTHGFVGADLRALATEAAMAAIRRERENDAVDTVTAADFERALSGVEPSAMREVVAEQPDVTYEDVGGLDDAKQALSEAVEWPLRYPSLFDATDTDPPTGVLLYGPPGTGKTMLARAAGAESGVNVIRVAGPELLDQYVGESERAVREVFERARQAAPALVFFDEIDAVAAARGDGGHEVTERVVSQLLTELDGVADNPQVVVLAATNRRDALDPALLRPGRLETHVEVPAPDREARAKILAIHARDTPLADDVDLDGLAVDLDGFTGAELAAVVRAASMRAIRRTVDAHGEDAQRRAGDVAVAAEDFDAAVSDLLSNR